MRRPVLAPVVAVVLAVVLPFAGYMGAHYAMLQRAGPDWRLVETRDGQGWLLAAEPEFSLQSDGLKFALGAALQIGRRLRPKYRKPVEPDCEDLSAPWKQGSRNSDNQ